jgi:hypothetical protein
MTVDTFHQRVGGSFRCPGSKRVYNRRGQSVAALPSADGTLRDSLTDRRHEHSNSIGVFHEFSDIAVDSEIAHTQ